MFYKSVVVSTIVFAEVSWGAGIKEKDVNRLKKLIRKAESVVGSNLATLEEMMDRMVTKLLVIMDNPSYPSIKHWTSKGQLQPQTHSNPLL